MKLGRNQACWCGSGKKFKKCHLNHREQEEIKPWEAEQNFRKAFGSKYCSVPDNLKVECKGNIVKAHTVSKSMNLKEIERNGHVYAFIPRFSNFKNFEEKGISPPELYGINNASTFTGFCAHHDKTIFSPLEDKVFEASKEQCFLLAYRAQAREYFTKIGATNLLPAIKEAVRGREPLLQEEARYHEVAVNVGLRDAKIYKNKLDNILNTKNFNNVNAYIINFNKTPSVLCSAGIFPECDFHGNSLQDLFDLKTTPDLLTFSAIATKTGGSVVFSWLNDSDSKGNCEKFIESLKKIAPTTITSYLIKFFFEFCENVFMEPTWWESLKKTKQKSLLKRFASATSPEEERKATCLCNDNLTLDDWGFSSTQEIK